MKILKNGSIASLEYERVIYGQPSEILLSGKDNKIKGLSEEDIDKKVEKERKKVRDALEKYCELDTLAEHEIILGLKKELKGKEKKL